MYTFPIALVYQRPCDRQAFFSLATLLAVSCVLTGCGQKLPDGLPKLYPVSISVIQEGEPLVDALLVMLAEDPDLNQWGPSGVTDTSGVAVMKTNARYMGAPLGSYKVLVSKTSTDPHPHEAEWNGMSSEHPNYNRYAAIAGSLPSYTYVEPQYAIPSDTPLRLEVTASQKVYTIDVGKKQKVSRRR